MGTGDENRNIPERVQDVFRQVFEDPALIVSGATTAGDIPTWDSLTHISLILALEAEFGIEFSSEEVTTMASVGDLFTMLQRKEDGRG